MEDEIQHAPSWNDCPPEILIMIFQYLDAKSLIDCMTINKKWRDIAETICQKIGWKIIAEQGLYNGGVHLLSTDLGWKRKVMNSCLWSFYASIGCRITKLHEYEVTPLSRRSYVYRDNMVIIDSTGITYYNVRNYERMKQKLMKCYNYEENDYITMNLTYTGQGSNTEINLHTKSCSDNGELHSQSSRCVNVISGWQTFHLSQEVCYVLLSNGELQTHRWDGRWVKTSQARYYGMPDYMFALYKYREDLYGLSQSKGLWRLNSALMQVKKICALNLPQNMLGQLQLALFYYLCSVVRDYGIVEKGSLDDFYNKLSYNITCAKFYGGIIFLGDSDGKVKICKPSYLVHDNLFDVRVHEVCNVLHFINTKQDPTIIDLKVFEDHDSHNLFIHTRTSICQVKIEPRCIVFDDDDR